MVIPLFLRQFIFLSSILNGGTLKDRFSFNWITYGVVKCYLSETYFLNRDAWNTSWIWDKNRWLVMQSSMLLILLQQKSDTVQWTSTSTSLAFPCRGWRNSNEHMFFFKFQCVMQVITRLEEYVANIGANFSMQSTKLCNYWEWTAFCNLCIEKNFILI